AYGNVARDLDESWGGQHGAAVTNPDFMKLADAYGVVGMRATKPTEVGDLVRKAVGMDRPVLIEVRVGRMARPAFFAPMKAPDKYQKKERRRPGRGPATRPPSLLLLLFRDQAMR